MHTSTHPFRTLAAVALATIVLAVEAQVDFGGTWVLQKTERSAPPMIGGGFPGGGGGRQGDNPRHWYSCRNSGMETCVVKTEQKMMHSEEYPSHILLPVIPQGGKHECRWNRGNRR